MGANKSADILKFNAVTKLYRTGDGVRDISFTVNSGQVVGLLGLNGSGKSTTMKLICGMLRQQSGEVQVMGQTPRDGRQNVAFLGDRQGFPSWMGPQEMMRFMKGFYPDFRPERFRDICKEIDVPPKPIGELSRGQQQKLKIAVTLARQSGIYLLDEPLAGIDIVAREGIMRMLVKYWDKSSAVMIATHEIADVQQFLNRALFLKDGSVLADESVDKINAQHESVAKRFLGLMGGVQA